MPCLAFPWLVVVGCFNFSFSFLSFLGNYLVFFFRFNNMDTTDPPRQENQEPEEWRNAEFWEEKIQREEITASRLLLHLFIHRILPILISPEFLAFLALAEEWHPWCKGIYNGEGTGFLLSHAFCFPFVSFVLFFVFLFWFLFFCFGFCYGFGFCFGFCFCLLVLFLFLFVFVCFLFVFVFFNSKTNEIY